MNNRQTGRYERAVAGGEEVSSYIPAPLPPTHPPITIDGKLADRLRLAEQAKARLELAGEMMPSIDWFIYAFVRKEAVLTSQIEGTQATLIDLMTFEAQAQTAPTADVEEVCNYLDALAYARVQLADETGLPLSMRLLGEAHRRLMSGVRGANKQPGEVRRTQNWIGGSRPGNAVFVPSPNLLPDFLGAFEKYLHDDDALPKLVRAGMAHVQFEALPRHPVVTVASAMKLIGATKPTAKRAVEAQVDAGILTEITGHRRDRSFACQAYLDRLRVGTDLRA
jgi:Fic family protein